MFVVGSLGCWQQIAHVISGVLKIDSAKFKRRLPGSEAKGADRIKDCQHDSSFGNKSTRTYLSAIVKEGISK